MADAINKVTVLDEQITAATDTHKNLAGLVEKLAKVQAALMEANLDALSDRVSQPFTTLSTAAEEIQALLHDMEEERGELIA